MVFSPFRVLQGPEMRKIFIVLFIATCLAPALAQQGRPYKFGRPGFQQQQQQKFFLLDTSRAMAKTGRVPNGFGKLGLNQFQKERIYGIQAVYNERIKQLEEEIEALKLEQTEQVRNVLNDIQRGQLEQYEAEMAASEE